MFVALVFLFHEHDYGAALWLTWVILVWAVLDLVVWVVRERRSA